MIKTFSNEIRKGIQKLKDFITHLKVTNASITDDSNHKTPLPSFDFEELYHNISKCIGDYTSINDWNSLMTKHL